MARRSGRIKAGREACFHSPTLLSQVLRIPLRENLAFPGFSANYFQGCAG